MPGRRSRWVAWRLVAKNATHRMPCQKPLLMITAAAAVASASHSHSAMLQAFACLRKTLISLVRPR
jgi:hypothetical protein